ncbi:MAG: right-handed parallel beta-helix repeat-containing protein [Candidatus Thorarchaeota archaeon]
MKKSIVFGILTIGLITFSLVITSKPTFYSLVVTKPQKEKLVKNLSAVKSHSIDLSLISHGSIIIDSDDDFVTYGFPGTGLENDPYVIENFNITPSSIYGVSISSTTKYFIIRNCYINVLDNHPYYGIYGIGISISNIASNTVKIINNTVDHCGYSGIHLDSTSDVLIENNTIININVRGLDVWDSDNTMIINNTISNNGYFISYNNHHCGFLLYDSNAQITNNTFSNNKNCGLWLFSSSVTLLFNSFTNDGLEISMHNIEKFESCIVNDNTINGKMLGWYVSQDNLLLVNSIFGQLFLINCKNSLINNQILGNASIGLYCHSCQNITISDSRISNSIGEGLLIGDSYNIKVSNNTISNNGEEGINLDFSDEVVITNNTIIAHDNDNGLYSRQSYGVMITENLFNNNKYGLCLEYSSNATIANNTINDNYGYGIWVENSPFVNITYNTIKNNGYDGIDLRYSDYFTIQQNTLNNNSLYGIEFRYSSNGIFTHNILIENEYYGVFLFSSDNNILVLNSLTENNLEGSSQAYDSSQDNLFLNNYWFDHTEPDDNDDDIVDIPYVIYGGSNTDEAPLIATPDILNIPPIIVNALHNPSFPTQDDIISISAMVFDNVKVMTVSLHFHADDEAWQEVPMIDIGNGYIANIGTFSTGSTIFYYITSQDSNGNVVQSSIVSFLIFEFNPPTITNITHERLSGSEKYYVLISASVTDDFEVHNVTLYYQRNSESWENIPMICSGDIYSVRIGKFGENAIIEYYIVAYDVFGNMDISSHYSFEMIDLKEGSTTSLFTALFAIFLTGYVLKRKRIKSKT